MTAVVAESRRRGLPLDVIVQDWLYWGRGMHRWSCMKHDPES
jgi:alpha-glucosidase (family GH31 glycosyl hydrolase)